MKTSSLAQVCGCAFGAALLALAGCMHPPAHDSARTGPFHAAVNHAAEPHLPANLRRVVLLPLAGGSAADAESAAALSAVFAAELQKQNRFEVVTLTRDDMLRRFRRPEVLSTAALPHDLVAKLRRDLAVDGVMFVDLTVYKPYRPMMIGVRAKLATAGEDVRLLWAFDNVFSAADPTVANSARHHFINSDRGGVPADLTPGVMHSPSKFAEFVAAQAFSTLPPVYVPAPLAATTGAQERVAVANTR